MGKGYHIATISNEYEERDRNFYTQQTHKICLTESEGEDISEVQRLDFFG